MAVLGSGFDDDFLPFRDVINEYYAKDISKKIKSTFKLSKSMEIERHLMILN